MKKNNKDFLYRTIFKLFLSKHYELVTVSDIEKATGMTRGAVFYYTHNKLSLFLDIVDTYFFKAQDLENKFKELEEKTDELTLLEFIHSYVKAVEIRMTKLQNTLNMTKAEATRAYLSFILQAQNYYSSFNEKITAVFDAELGIWEKVLTSAQAKGEIKSNIDVKYFARIFRYFYVGLCYQSSLANGMNAAELEIYLMSIYMLVKE